MHPYERDTDSNVSVPRPGKEAADSQPGDSWFTRPLSGWRCVIGWCVSVGVFIGIVAIAGGPAVGDAWETIYATWAAAHGQFACFYPPHPPTIFTYAAPVYPLLTGGITGLAQVGHGVSFPSGAALGHNCAQAIPAMIHWSQRGGGIVPTLRAGYLSWLLLMAGLIWFLRSTRRGRSGWEPTTLLIVAVLPPVWLSYEQFFHPQDIMAMGFALLSMGCALRNQWFGAGVLIALATFTQQYTLLVAVPLLVVAPGTARVRYIVAAIISAAAISLPILALAAHPVASYVFFGSGNSAGLGGTLVWEMHLHGFPLLFLSRILPLLGSLFLSLYVVRRVGSVAARQPALLLSLVAVSLALRLVFEQNIFAYYYLAMAVTLVVLDVVRGRIRETLVAWFIMVSLVYTEDNIIVWRQFWGRDARHWIPAIVIAVALLLTLRSVRHHRVGWSVAMWGAVVVTALLTWPVSSDPISHPLAAAWFWQVILVAIGTVLAIVPLVAELRQNSRLEPSAEPAEKIDPLPSSSVL
jgi:hypothetical protein